MKIIGEINLLEKSKKMIFLYIVANLTVIPLFILFSLIGHVLTGVSEVQFDLGGITFAFVSLFLLIIIHELIHALFYKLINPKAKIQYAFHGVAFSTSSPGAFYSTGQMLLVSLAPFVVITSLLTVSLLTGLINVLLYVFLASFHTSGCFGDFYCAGLLLLKYRKGFLIEDRGDVLKIYQTS